MEEPFSVTWIQADGETRPAMAMKKKKSKGGTRTTSHRNDSAAVCRGGTDPFTQSGEKGTERDHYTCEGPRAAILAEKNKTQSDTRDRGSSREAPPNTALLPHLL